jgi:hypothetical protein
MTLVIGYWVIPLLVTIAAFLIAGWLVKGITDDGSMGAAIVGPFMAVIFVNLALVASLISWLIYAVVT